MSQEVSNLPFPVKQLATQACRQTGRAVIKDIIIRHQRRIQYLETLLALLPETLTGDQDNALWNIATSLERP